MRRKRPSYGELNECDRVDRPPRPERSINPAEARKMFHAAIAHARLYRASLIKNGVDRKEVTGRTVTMLKRVYRQLFGGKRTETVINYLNRRPREERD